MPLRPRLLLLLDPDLIKPVRRARREGVFPDDALAALLLDLAQVARDAALDARFLPGLAAGGFFLRALVGFPAALWEDPAFAVGGLDEEDLGAVGGEGDDASDEAFAARAVSGEKLLARVTSMGGWTIVAHLCLSLPTLASIDRSGSLSWAMLAVRLCRERAANGFHVSVVAPAACLLPCTTSPHTRCNTCVNLVCEMSERDSPRQEGEGRRRRACCP